MSLSSNAAAHYRRLTYQLEIPPPEGFVEYKPQEPEPQKPEPKKSEPERYTLHYNQNRSGARSFVFPSKEQTFIYHAKEYMRLDSKAMSETFHKWTGRHLKTLTPDIIDAIIQFILDKSCDPEVTPGVRSHFGSVMDHNKEMEQIIEAYLTPE